MKIVSEKSKYHRFALYCDYSKDRIDFLRSLKDSFGWDKFSYEAIGDIKRWIFSDSLFIPVLVERFPEIQVDPQVEVVVRVEQSWLNDQKIKNDTIDDIRTKKDTEFNVKGLKKELYPYQKVGVEFLIASGGRAIVADAPGLGKTAQALAYIKHMGYKRSLVVSPASVKFAWQNEVAKWTNLSCVVIDSKTDISKIDSSIAVWIINYDILKKHHAQLTKIRFDCIVGDECQLIKSTQAIRTKSFRQISREIESIVLLSGTPLLSRPSELFSLLNIIDMKTWNNWYEFARRYCNMHQTRWGMDTSGSSNPEELHARIMRYFIRRDKSEVLKELPPKTFIDVPLELSTEYSRKYKTAAGDLATYLRQYQGKQNAQIAKAMAAEKLTQLNILRHLNSMGKIDTAIELAESIVDAGEKVLIFCSFVEPLEILKKHFGDKAVIITGKTPVDERGAIVSAFQSDKKVQIFLGGYKSAGTGITLTAAQNFIGIDFPWNPADLSQSIDRLHRPGQVANSVNIYQLVTLNTIDEDMKDILDHKQGIFDQVIDGKIAEKGKDVMQAVIGRILKDY